IGAHLAASAYLALAGYPLPAQRSFVMVAFVFAAILTDRKGISLRSLCFAALFILLAFPESVYSASFKLSFAATLAIVSLYEHWPLPTPTTRFQKVLNYTGGILATSLAASLATAPFVMHDFNRLSVLGIFSNMLILPLASAVIMPAIIGSLALMPLGLAQLAYWPLGWGLRLMLETAEAVSTWPLASLRSPGLTDAGLALAALGLLWLCLWRGRLRLWGIPMLATALCTIAQHLPVDVYVSNGVKQVMARLPDGNYTTLKGTSRAYAVKTWLQHEAQSDLVPLKESGIPCESGICRYERGGHTLLMVTNTQTDTALNTACAQNPDILIAPRYLKKSRCPGPALLIGKNELEDFGPHALYMNESVRVTRTHTPGQRRQWQPEITDDWEEEL
ncbi:MAG: ComEC/Rec2 family competence protein, partial [Rickettsiales bacterium]|nr:ComEC/Rec2 family competence protein [Rickettsiales bacterium]